MKARRRDTAPPTVEPIDPEELQRAADAAEAETAAQYIRLTRLTGLLSDAIRRADAFSRLDAALQGPDHSG